MRDAEHLSGAKGESLKVVSSGNVDRRIKGSLDDKQFAFIHT